MDKIRIAIICNGTNEAYSILRKIMQNIDGMKKYGVFGEYYLVSEKYEIRIMMFKRIEIHTSKFDQIIVIGTGEEWNTQKIVETYSESIKEEMSAFDRIVFIEDDNVFWNKPQFPIKYDGEP